MNERKRGVRSWFNRLWTTDRLSRHEVRRSEDPSTWETAPIAAPPNRLTEDTAWTWLANPMLDPAADLKRSVIVTEHELPAYMDVAAFQDLVQKLRRS